MKEKSIVVFDADGVLVDSWWFHHQNHELFFDRKLPLSILKEIGKGNFFGHKLTREYFAGADWHRYVQFIAQKQSNLKMKSSVTRMLRRLSKKHRFFIVTSGSEVNIRAFLKKNGVDGLFEDVLGMETHGSKTEKFRMIFQKTGLHLKNLLFVTDTLGDIREANHVCVRTVAVTFGYHSRYVLSHGKPLVIVDTIRQLERSIREWRRS